MNLFSSNAGDKSSTKPAKSSIRFVPLLAVLGLVMVAVIVFLDPKPLDDRFVRVEDGKFVLAKQPYVFTGMNYWQGAYLGAEVIPGGKARLLRELDLLKKYGITNLRLTAASEKSDMARSVTPAFQTSLRVYNEKLLLGMDFLLDEMAKRDMKAVMVMGNYWEWSGGMAQYVAWVNNQPVVDPSKVNDATLFMSSVSEFYRNAKAQDAYFDYLKHVLQRTNTINGRPYNEDPTVMTWELANEPRPHPNSKEQPSLLEGFYGWIDGTAKRIHRLAPKQLVTVGNEGSMGCLNVDDIYVKAHAFKSIDYLTFHIWPKNWGWFSPKDEKNSLENSIKRTLQYIEEHVQIADKLGKPTVIEEFGIGRDGENPSPDASVRSRDTFLKAVLGAVEKDVRAKRSAAGTNYWAWGGEGRARNAEAVWVEGTDFTGDPPQEPQGLNSVFDTDLSTLTILLEHAARLQKIVNPPN